MRNQLFTIRWGAGAAPTSFVIDAGDGTRHTPTLTLGITETATGSGRYKVVASVDPAWGNMVGVFVESTGDEWEADYGNSVDTGTAGGTVVRQLTSLTGIQVNAISPTNTVGTTVIVQGDDYINGNLDDRRLTYSVDGYVGVITSATVTWKLVPRKAYDKRSAAAAEITVTSGTASLVGSVLTMKVPVTRVQTATLTDVSQTDTDYRYKVQVMLVGSDGETLTEVIADAVVLKKVS